MYYFVTHVLTTAPRKFRDLVRESFYFSREDGGFRNKEFQTTVKWVQPPENEGYDP